MRGYFARLAKHSGVAIGTRNPSARSRPGPLRRVTPDVAGAPLHVETIDLEDSVSPAGEARLQSRSMERSIHQDAFEGARQLTRNDAKISSESEQAGKQVAASDVPSPSISTSTDDQNKQIAELSETSFFREGATRSLALEKTSESEPDVAGSSSEALEGQSGGKGGVVRVGELVSSIEQKPAPEPDSFSELTRMIGRQERSIPPDYLEGIREWLASPATGRQDIPSQSATDHKPGKVSSAPERADRSLHSNFVVRDSATQNDIQEFNLSIGSISIIVEEPRQQPAQRFNSVQPAESAPVSTQTRTRDAFALSRSYFRGF